jgi:small subunit ribosomal protein S1
MSETPIKRVRGLTELPASANKASEATPQGAAPASASAPAPVQPPARPAGPKASPASGPAPRPPRDRADDGPAPRRSEDVDAELDRQLDDRLAHRGTVGLDVNFKRQKDVEVEAELDSIMSGFDPGALSTGGGARTRAKDRADQPKAGIGQEERTGIQKAKIVSIRGNTVFLDLGAKSEGVVPLEQFGENPPQVGETVEVVFDRYDKEEGLLVMSRQGAAVAATWANLKKGLIVEARVTKAIKGGAEVEVNGIRGFLPISQIEMAHVENAGDYVNQKLRCVVTEVNVREKNLVVSRRDLLEKERAEKREKTWAELEEGQTRTGVVRSIKPFGAFVDLGGVDGLILVQNLAWGRVNDPSDVVKTGQEVEVKVLTIDRDTQRISLGLKQLKESPWDTLKERYHVGQYVSGKVTRLMEFGAFVELEPGIEGLIHLTELGPRKVYRVKDVVQPEQTVDVRILKIEPELKRISLSLKPAPGAPVKVEGEDDDEDEGGPPPRELKPRFDLPLKGGLGDHDPNPFGQPPK